jgi:hypothetical protein
VILLEQLKMANQRWKLLEEGRVRILEIFLSLILLTGFALLITDLENSFLLKMDSEVRMLIPIIFLLAGLSFYVLFWYREIDLRISKSWVKRIEEEIHKFYKGENPSGWEMYDGAYFLFYYDAKNDLDLAANFLGLAIISLTTMIVVLTSQIFSSESINLFFWICVIVFPAAKLILKSILNNKYQKNAYRYPPKQKSSINLSSILKNNPAKTT